MTEKCGAWAMGLLTLFGLCALLAASVLVGVAVWPDPGIKNDR